MSGEPVPVGSSRPPPRLAGLAAGRRGRIAGFRIGRGGCRERIGAPANPWQVLTFKHQPHLPPALIVTITKCEPEPQRWAIVAVLRAGERFRGIVRARH